MLCVATTASTVALRRHASCAAAGDAGQPRFVAKASPISGAMAFHNLAIIEAARMASDARRAIDITEI